MVTPVEGMPSVMFTVNGNEVPGAGGSTVPTAGVVVTLISDSPHPLLPLFFLQAENKTRIIIAKDTDERHKRKYFTDKI